MTRRLGAALMAAVTAVTLLPATALAATFDRGTADSCPTGLPDEFKDDESSVHEANINCIAFWAIAAGKTATTYAPGDPTRRDHMVSLTVKFMQTAGYVFPTSGADAFDDDESSVHEANVNRLAAIGLVGGTSPRRFSPGVNITRDQLATFIASALERIAGVTLSHDEDFFTDDAGNPHQNNINDLAELGIVQGTGTKAYSPRGEVRRDQIASFIAKGADYVAERGRWPAFGSNQSYRVAPAAADVNTVSSSTNDNTGAHTYTAFVGTASTVDLALVPCNEVAIATNGTVSFGDDEGTAAQADDLGNTSAVVETVNGTAVSGLGDHVNNASAVNSAVSFRADSTAASICVRAVVFRDTDNDNQLDLDANDRPTEAFGIGGEKRWVAAEASAGAFTIADVIAVDKTGDNITGNPGIGARTYFYDSNDTFKLNGANSTLTAFEALSAFDQVTGTYDPDPADKSTFELTDIDPVAPTAATAAVNGTTLAVTVSWTTSTTPNVDAYRLSRATTATDCTAEGTYAQVGEVVGTQLSFVQTVAAGRYCYKVRAVDDGDDSGDSNEVLADVQKPTVSDLRAASGAGATLTSGDFVQFIFSEAMAAAIDDGGASVRFSDADGTVADVVCLPSTSPAANASCVLQPAGTYNLVARAANVVLRLQLTADPTIVTNGTTPTLALPATLVSVTSHWTDAATNPLNVSGSADKTLNVDTVTPAPETTAPAFSAVATADESDDTVTIAYTEPVVCENTAATRAQFTFTDNDNVAGVQPTAITCNWTATVVLIFADGAIQVADSAELITYDDDDDAAVDGNDVRDLNGNQAGPDDTVAPVVSA